MDKLDAIKAALEEGFFYSYRDGAYVCLDCGAMVPLRSRVVHLDWHLRQVRELKFASMGFPSGRSGSSIF